MYYTIIVTDLYSDDPSSNTISYQIQKNNITIGRSRDNDVMILHTNISSRHAEIIRTDRCFFLKDLNSTNGTLVNKSPVQGSIRIFSDDQIELGGTLIRVTGHPDLERSNAGVLDGMSRGEYPYRLDENPQKQDLNDILPAADMSPSSDLDVEPPLGDDFSLSKIAPAPFGALRPSVSLDSLIPSHDSEIYQSSDPSSEVPMGSPFPDQDAADNIDLLNKIKALESKVISDKGEKEKNENKDRKKDYLGGSIVVIKAIDPIPSGINKVTEFPTLPIFIGRNDDCEICLPDTFVSGKHATLELKNGRLHIRDLKSRNGTYVNNRKIIDSRIVESSDIISVGRFRFTTSLSRKDERPGRQKQRETVSATGNTPELQESYDKVIAGNIYAISLQLYLARGAIGKALEDIQGKAMGQNETRRICRPLAIAIRTLYDTQLSGVDDKRLQKIVDSVIEHTTKSLELMCDTNDVSMAKKEVIKAHSILFPLSSEGCSYLESTSVPIGLSLLSELGFLGVQKKRVCTTKEEIMLNTVDVEGVMVAGTKFSASLNNLSYARTLTKCIADIFYFDKYESLKLVNIVDEACTNSIEHGFGFKEQDYFCLSFVLLSDNRLAVLVDDKGLPFDTEKAEMGGMDGLGIRLIREFCEEVHFLNLGRKGKRVLMILPLPDRSSEALFLAVMKTDGREESATDPQYTIETLNSEQADEIPKCVYRAYRYQYYDDQMYRPNELKNLLRSGKMLSAMVFTKNRDAVGHMSVSMEEPDSKIGLLDHMIIVPSLNSANMASRLTTYMIEKCRERGMSGLLVNMTASHPYEQIVYNSLGARVTGIMLGHFPAKHEIADISGDFGWKTKRQSSVTAYLILSDVERQEVYLPRKYSDILKEIYDKSGLNRKIMDSIYSDDQMLPAISNVVTNITSSLGTASIKVLEIGDDIADIIEAKLDEISNEPIVSVYMDLPLSSPSISPIIDRLEKYRFCFSCLIPEERNGDILRLQIIKADVDVGNIHIEENYGKSILKKINEERKECR